MCPATMSGGAKSPASEDLSDELEPISASFPWSQMAINASTYYDRLYKGQPTMSRTPLYKDKTPDEILAMWLQILRQYRSKYPELVTYDESRTSKWGARGGFPPMGEMRGDLMKYRTRMKVIDPQHPLIKKAVNRVILLLKIPRLKAFRPLDPATVMDVDTEEDKLNSSSGAPDFRKRSNPAVQQHAIADAKSGKWREYPYMIAMRTQKHEKVRFIFMAPFASNLKEKAYIIPLMKMMRANSIPALSAWEGFDQVEKVLPSKQDTELVSTDFTGMDQTFGPTQLEVVLQVLRNIFQDDKDMALVFRNCLVAPVQVTYDSAWTPTIHALPSGAGGTNFFETVLALVLHELAILIQGKPHTYQVLGDDGIAFGQPGLTEAIVQAADMLGLEMNPSKQRKSDHDYVYLQRYFNTREIPGRGAYPTVLAVNACVFPERFHNPKDWSPRMESLRWIMVLENCKHHPAFQDLVRFIRDGDKYHLDLGPNAEELYAKAKEIPGFVPSYNQASRERGILEFETVKLLKKWEVEQ